MRRVLLLFALFLALALLWFAIRVWQQNATRAPSAAQTAAQRARFATGEVPSDGLSHEVAIEDPSGRALLPLYRALTRAEHGQARARLVFYGGSHTASDEYTGIIRKHLQDQYGNGGHGFVLPVPTYAGFSQSGIDIEEAHGFNSIRPSSERRGIDSYGIAGIRFDTRTHGSRRTEGATAALSSDNAPFDVARFWVQPTPHGGSFSIAIDGLSQRIVAHGPAAFEEARIAVASGDHEIAIRASDNARLFGIVLERGHTGVVVDNLALTGSKARHHLFWDETLWASMLHSLAPDFISLAYGNNEAEDTHLTFAEHRAQFGEMLARVRRNFPDAGCLVIGPGYRRVQHGSSMELSTFTIEMNAAQRELAFEYGCAFFNTQGFQGGPESLSRWSSVFPIPWLRDDGVHWSPAAYHRFGEVLLRALLRDADEHRES